MELTEKTQRYQIYPVFLPICKVPMAVKVMCKSYNTVFECDIKHYSKSFFKLPE